MASEAAAIQGEPGAWNICVPDVKSSRCARNDDKWDLLKEKIYDEYMVKDRTLQNTKQTIEERHGYVARYDPLQDVARRSTSSL